jgi:hypothetical protein
MQLARNGNEIEVPFGLGTWLDFVAIPAVKADGPSFG